MVKEVMKRQASDNEYLHRDFHKALSGGIEYLHFNYGEQAVREYLRQFANRFYAPLKEDLRQRGLVAIREHYEKIYKIEGGKIDITFSEDELILKVEACPAVTHLRKGGYPVARLFYETTKTVNEVICQGSEFLFELVEYDQQTGRSVQRFYRRKL
jgi:hypothetical protein